MPVSVAMAWMILPGMVAMFRRSMLPALAQSFKGANANQAR